MADKIQAVTGAFGYSGKYIARHLLAAGHSVMTLTDSPHRANPFADKIRVCPYNFANPGKLAESLRGVEVLYNTYWVRFNHCDFQHALAVANTLSLFAAAARAGVRRIVHVSITNPDEQSPLEYFRGKAKLEKALMQSGLSYAILRPAVLFGEEDILINNIAWLLRKFPVFGVFGDGSYRLQPIHVDDFARLAVAQGAERENRISDATGPETFTYRELVRAIGRLIGKPRPIISIPDFLGYSCGRLIGALTGDVVITREEIAGLKADLLYTASPPAGTTRLSEWAKAKAATLGLRYASELARRRNRIKAYGEL